MNKRLLGLVAVTAAVITFLPATVAGAPTAAPSQVQVPPQTPTRAVQLKLKSYGYTIAVDGVYGPQTTDRVRRWQRSNGLLTDGLAGPATLRSLGLEPLSPHSDAPKIATEPSSAPQVEHYDQWVALSRCESGGNWAINTGNGYYGGLQFSLQSWRAVGGSGYPHHNSAAEQMVRAEKLLDIQGWGAWPACSRKLGYR